MRVIAVSSKYRIRGGEDESFESAVALLRERGHDVVEFIRTAAELAESARAVQAARVAWNRRAAAELAELVRTSRPDVAYVGPYFPALSASVLDVLGRAGVPIVLSVQSYRLVCVNGLLYRDDRPCRRCVTHRAPAPAILHRCYRGSVVASAVGVASLVATRGVLRRHAARITFAAVSDHVRRFLVDDVGVPANRVHVKPNTLHVVPPPNWDPEDFVLFAGRLEPEKGVREAVEAVCSIPNARLVVVGTGSLADELRRRPLPERVEIMGERPHAEIIELMSRARATMVNSHWEEPFGRVAMESLACGTPVIASNRGGLTDIVEHMVSGIVVAPEDGGELRAAVRLVLTDPVWATDRRKAARARFDSHFSPELVSDRIQAILESAVRDGRARQDGPR